MAAVSVLVIVGLEENGDAVDRRHLPFFEVAAFGAGIDRAVGVQREVVVVGIVLVGPGSVRYQLLVLGNVAVAAQVPRLGHIVVAGHRVVEHDVVITDVSAFGAQVLVLDLRAAGLGDRTVGIDEHGLGVIEVFEEQTALRLVAVHVPHVVRAARIAEVVRAARLEHPRMLVRSGFLLRHRSASVVSAAACKGKREHRRATRDEQSRQGLRSMPTDMSSSDFHEVPFRSGHSSSYSICEKSCDIKHPKAQICEGPSPEVQSRRKAGTRGGNAAAGGARREARRATQDGRRTRDRLARGTAATARQGQRTSARLAHLHNHHNKHADSEPSRDAERRLIGEGHTHRS